MKYLESSAEFSDDKLYRYILRRKWSAEKLPTIAWVMLNPSTADSAEDDATIRRCVAFSKSWNFGACDIYNLFAWRSTDPKVLKQVADPIGPKNNAYLSSIADDIPIVCAWGIHGSIRSRGSNVLKYMLRGTVYFFKTCANGEPCHPLYLPRIAILTPYRKPL